jgi:hypothetical protein
MAKNCTFCQIVRLFAVSSASACFAGLAILCLMYDMAVPIWVITGFLVSVAVAIWVIGAYLRERRRAATADALRDGAKG